ncbi:MAG TPA: elongation factor G [Anaerolineaceae bacterium]|jgi:elongation factor G|nr:elongation factor G [Anaerolineaceae bacterium]
MKEYTTDSIRNVALASHSGLGKTMLAEAFLHFSGATTRLGKIEDGTTISDFDEEEVRRGISIYTSVLPVEYKNVKVNFLDTPGYNDFIGEVISALRVADSAILLVDAVSGVEVGTEIAWDYCNRFSLPRFVVINKMDRDNANYAKALAAIEAFSDLRLVPLQLPWGEKAAFQGVIDLLTMKAYKGDGKTVVEIPGELRAAADEARVKLMEMAAEGDDTLMEKYFEAGTLSDDEILRGLRAGVISRSFAPVFVSAASAEIGIGPLLDAIVTLLPSPAEAPRATAQGKDGDEVLAAADSGPLAAYVWKTTADPFVGKQTFFRVYSGMISSDSRVWNQNKSIEERFGTISVPRGKEIISIKVLHSGDIGVVPKLSETSTSDTLCDKAHPLTLPRPEYPGALYRVAVHPKTQADSTKLSATLTRQCEEDMTLSWHNDQSTNQTILQGMGDQHIEVAIRRAETRFQVGIVTGEPRVPYRETITRKGSAMYRHKKQTGGSGQFGEVHMRVEPYPEGDFDFVWEVFGGAVSQSYANSITKGIQSVMKEGVLAGYPISGVRVAITDGKEHPVDSKPIAFEIAGREAFKLAFKEAGAMLLEPIMMVKIMVPEGNMGDVLGDLNTRRARVMGMDSDRGHSTITATVPLAEMQRYTTQLRSITGGRGIFTMEFERYENVPPHLTQELVAIRQKEMESKKEE